VEDEADKAGAYEVSARPRCLRVEQLPYLGSDVYVMLESRSLPEPWVRSTIHANSPKYGIAVPEPNLVNNAGFRKLSLDGTTSTTILWWVRRSPANAGIELIGLLP
jgi:hypothetical protein